MAAELKTKVDPNGRVCCKCGEYKPWMTPSGVTNFHKARGGRGWTSYCKLCIKKTSMAKRQERKRQKIERDILGRPKGAVGKNYACKKKAHDTQKHMSWLGPDDIFLL